MTSKTTRAIRIHGTGGPEVMKLEEVKLGPPGAGEVQVRHEAIGVNFIDVYHRTGLYPLPSFPQGLGVEGAGVISAVGDDTSGLRVGQRVGWLLASPGGYAEARNVAAHRVVPLPDDVDAADAAGSLLRGMTVEYLLRRTFRVEPGMTVLFHAAAGGVGLLACQWLDHIGATVIGTVGSDEKAALAKAHGCHHPVVYTRDDFAERVRELTGGEGVHVVYDSVGKDTFDASLSCLRPRGMLVGFGNASGAPPPFDPMALARGGSLFLTRASLYHYVASRDELLASATALFGVLRSGAVKAQVRQRFALAEAADAHRALEGRATTGSTILLP
jgi:NADPH2:quinone reductase